MVSRNLLQQVPVPGSSRRESGVGPSWTGRNEWGRGILSAKPVFLTTFEQLRCFCVMVYRLTLWRCFIVVSMKLHFAHKLEK